VVGHAVQYARDPFGFMVRNAREYGPVAYARCRRGRIGNGFALMELRLILPTILQRWHLEPASTAPLELMASITTRPRHGIPMVVRER
jgi:cytochrome P450